MRLTAFAAVAVTIIFAALPARADNPFGTWAVVVVAGDSRAEGGAPTEAFDNARRDVTAELVNLGFHPANIRQFSTRPNNYANEPLFPSNPHAIYGALSQTVRQAPGGCLIYFSSHGNRQGVVVGDVTVVPHNMAQIVNDNCGQRPTVVILSACYSGIFVQALAGPSRMVLTAARPDRTSFGCGVSDRYPYFDTCFLREVPAARDFVRLGLAVQQCVTRLEAETGSEPPSEPQLTVGDALAPHLARSVFAHGIGACGVTSTDPNDAGC
jgi:hypothetical protein